MAEPCDHDWTAALRLTYPNEQTNLATMTVTCSLCAAPMMITLISQIRPGVVEMTWVEGESDG